MEYLPTWNIKRPTRRAPLFHGFLHIGGRGDLTLSVSMMRRVHIDVLTAGAYEAMAGAPASGCSAVATTRTCSTSSPAASV